MRLVFAIAEDDDALKELGVSEADAIVHLAGENLFAKRWSEKQKMLLRTSRIEKTRMLAALAAARRPAVLLSASAVGWYGASDDRPLDDKVGYRSGTPVVVIFDARSTNQLLTDMRQKVVQSDEAPPALAGSQVELAENTPVPPEPGY